MVENNLLSIMSKDQSFPAGNLSSMIIDNNMFKQKILRKWSSAMSEGEEEDDSD